MKYAIIFFIGLIVSCGQPSRVEDFRGEHDGSTDKIGLSSAALLSEGEGDCDDSSQCKSGLKCVNTNTGQIESFDNSIKGRETCEMTKPKSTKSLQEADITSFSHFQVIIDGKWKGISCSGSRATVSRVSSTWLEHERFLIDIDNQKILDCPEGRKEECDCNDIPEDLFDDILGKLRSVEDRDLRPHGEAFHGHLDGPVSSSIEREIGDSIFPDIGRANCMFVTGKNELSIQATNGSRNKKGQWTDNRNCDYFRFQTIP